MKIIQIPHPTLRQPAKPVKRVDTKLIKFVSDLQSTLAKTKNPKGVGLAAPQVDKLWRIFATAVNSQPMVFINPVIVKHSQKLILGPKGEDEILEGCLSMPNLYGAVPRWEWINLEYQVVDLGDLGGGLPQVTAQVTAQLAPQLTPRQGKFADFHARVIQHELDHLNGILFTDHSLAYDLPVYQERDGDTGTHEVDRAILELI